MLSVGDRSRPSLEGLRFVVVGPGRLGIGLALAMRAKGASFLGYASHDGVQSERARTLLGLAPSAKVEDLLALAPDLYLLTVPDDTLPAVAAELGLALSEDQSRPARGKEYFVLHTSGVTSVRVLDPCRDAGATTAVFHPLQTFTEPGQAAAGFEGIAVAVSADSRGAEDLGLRIADALGARPFALADEKRGLYHAAACFASNYLVTLESCARRLFVDAGLPTAEALGLFLPLVRTTVENISALGPEKALTGPIARGDVLTVSRHLEELRRAAPDLVELYAVLGLATLGLAGEPGGLAPTTIAQMRSLLNHGGADSPRTEIHDRGTP